MKTKFQIKTSFYSWNSDIVTIIDHEYVKLHYDEVVKDISQLNYYINSVGDKSVMNKSPGDKSILNKCTNKFIRYTGNYVSYEIFLENWDWGDRNVLVCKASRRVHFIAEDGLSPLDITIEDITGINFAGSDAGAICPRLHPTRV
jgi:hypothetical protein